MSHSQRRDAPGLGSKFVLIRVPHLFLLPASYYDCAHGHGTCIQVLAIEKRGLRRPSDRQFAEASPGECGNFNRFRLKHFSSSSGSYRGSRFHRRRYREYCQVQRYQRQSRQRRLPEWEHAEGVDWRALARYLVGAWKSPLRALTCLVCSLTRRLFDPLIGFFMKQLERRLLSMPI